MRFELKLVWCGGIGVLGAGEDWTRGLIALGMKLVCCDLDICCIDWGDLVDLCVSGCCGFTFSWPCSFDVCT